MAFRGYERIFFRLSIRLFWEYFGGLLRAFEGLLEGVLGDIKAKALVMLASSGA